MGRIGGLDSIIRRTWSEHERLAFVAFVFELLALIALGATPIIMLRHLGNVAEEFTATVLPAYAGLNDFLFAVEARMVALRTATLTGDTSYVAKLERGREAEAAAFQKLEALAPRFGSEYATHIAVLRRLSNRRDSLKQAVGGTNELGVPANPALYIPALSKFDVLRDSMLAEARHLRQELADVANTRTRETARWAELQGVVSVVLGLLALVAGVIVGWFTYMQMQQRRQIREALRESNRLRTVSEQRREELERVAESRIRLLSGITHDVKNPIGAAKGYAELLEMGIKAPLAPGQEPMVQGIKRSLDSAVAIISDLLDISRAESGALTIRNVPMDLVAVTRDAVEDYRALAHNANLTLRFYPKVDQLQIASDPARVRQIIDNLLSNAIKYTPSPGRIEVEVEVVRPAGEEGARSIVRVRDTGPGIPPRMRESIFDEFRRLTDDSVKGHGLGLAISRRVARMLGGDVTLENLHTPGATFVLSLPYG